MAIALILEKIHIFSETCEHVFVQHSHKEIKEFPLENKNKVDTINHVVEFTERFEAAQKPNKTAIFAIFDTDLVQKNGRIRTFPLLYHEEIRRFPRSNRRAQKTYYWRR